MSNSYDRKNINLPNDPDYIALLGAVQYSINYVTYCAFLLLKKISPTNKKEYAEFTIDSILDAFVELNRDEKITDIVNLLGEIIFRRNAIYNAQTVSLGEDQKDIETHASNRQILWFFDALTGDEIYITNTYLSKFLDFIETSIRRFNSLISGDASKILN